MPSNQYGLAGSATRSPSGMRRSSAAGITHHRPPLPPSTIGKRSQSLDGLLDTANNTCTTIDNINTEGASDDTPNTLTIPDTHTSYDTTDSINQTPTNHRRSRSLEDLLDERDEIHSNYDSHSKSVDSSIDTLSLTTEPSTELVKDDETGNDDTHKTDTSSIGSASSLNPSQTEKPCSCETITVENTVPQSENETDSSVAASVHPSVDDDRASNLTAYSRQGSTTSKDSDNKKKTFLNRYVKKVKSFIKK